MPVADGEPGQELQLDTGWMTLLEPDEAGKRRRFKAFIFTPNVSRYRFVYPVFRERTEDAIAACEAAWEFYGGVFRVLIPDNTKAIVQTADPLEPLLNEVFLEYAQARGFHIDPARVRRPQDKGRVEKSVRDTRDDCFGGEHLWTLEQSPRAGAGVGADRVRHAPPHHDAAAAARALRERGGGAPAAGTDDPLRRAARGGSRRWGAITWRRWSARCTRCPRGGSARGCAPAPIAPRCASTSAGELIKTHPRKPPGERSIDPADFPDEKRPYALRDIAYLQSQATACGPAVGWYAAALLAGPLPWTRMRRVYALLRLVRRYGEARVDASCETALAHRMLNVRRLENMLKHPLPPPPAAPARALPPARYLRDPRQYALRAAPQATSQLPLLLTPAHAGARS